MCLIFNFPVIFRSTPRQVSTALSRAKKLKKNKSNDKNGWAKYYTHQPQSRFPSSCLTRESPYTMFVNGSHRSLFYFFAAAFRTRIFSSRSFFFGATTTIETGWDGWWEHIDMEAQEWERKTFALIQLFFFASLTTTSGEGGEWKSARRKEKFSVFFFCFHSAKQLWGLCDEIGSSLEWCR